MTMTIAEAAAALAARLDTPLPEGESSPEFRLSFARTLRIEHFKNALLEKAAEGVLRIRIPDGGYALKGAETSESSQVDIAEAQAALEAMGEKFVPNTGALENTAPHVQVTNSAKPMPRQRFQEVEILRVISDLGYSAQSLPKTPPGTKGVKNAVRAALKFSVGVFDKAWQRLRDTGEIKENT